MTALDNLAAEWRKNATLLQECGASDRGALFSKVAGQLEAAMRECQLELLTLDQAATEGGYSYSSLEKRLRSGELPNAGTKGSPRIRRGDMPTKGGRMSQVDGFADQILKRRAQHVSQPVKVK